MKPVLDRNDREFLEQLHRLGDATVPEICTHFGVTATAVRQRLNRLQAANFVGREKVSHGRGRPHHVYRVTNAGTKQLGENYSDLALILWRELRQIPEIEVRERVAGRIREALISRYANVVNGASLDERIDQLREALSERGFDVEVDRSNPLPILRENNCPYPELADSDPYICQLEQEVFEQVLGTEVTLSQCCRDGDRCCEFQAGR